MALPNHDNIIHYGPEEDIEANIFTHNDGFRNRSPDTVHFNPERNVYYSPTCVVCLQNPPVEVVWPCRHACLCRPCAGRLKILSSRCPEDPESEAERRSWEEFQEDMAVLDSLNRIMDDPGKSEEQNAEARRKYEDYVRKTTEHSLVVCSDGTTFGGGHHPRGMVFDNRVRSRVEETFSVEELRQNNVYGDPRRGYGEHLVAIEGTPTSAEDQAFKPRSCIRAIMLESLGSRTTQSEECCSVCQEEENAHEGAYMLHPSAITKIKAAAQSVYTACGRPVKKVKG
ncbi:3'-flap-structured DNA binding [Branchiostoma belcheri]|nr:3'-flap-structured DNA binding [Branchiostoma belcheri]